MTSSATQSSVLAAGYNHDIPFRGEVYHVQTEQLCPDGRGLLVTEIYRQGQVVASHRIPKPPQDDTPEARQQQAQQMRDQHKAAIKCLLADKLDRLAAVLERREPAPSLGRSPTAPRKAWQPKMSRVVPHHSGSQDLGLRRALVRFVRAVGDEPPAEIGPIGERLRSIATAMAVMLNHEGVARLRRDDLAELMMTRSETLQFLREPSTVEQGQALWGSFAHLAGLFAAINRRGPLCRHDHEVLGRVVSTWSGVEDREREPDAVALALLKSCWGRDATLDGLLEDRRGLTIAKLFPEVLRITRGLDELLRSGALDSEAGGDP